MGLFRSGKTLPEKADDERAKVQMKQLKLASKNLDIASIDAENRRKVALKRLTA